MKNEKYYADYYRMTGKTCKISLKNIVRFFMFHNLQYMYFYRIYEKRPGAFLRFVLYRYTRKYGLEISTKAVIGEGLYLGHPYNITVAEGVKIGKNVNLHKGCTIGRENRGVREGTPTIGDTVYVGINSTIVGNIIIGNDVMIAPNSVVNFDVPPHSIVFGNPGIIHPKEESTEQYINFRI